MFLAKVLLICGPLCAGKSTLARKLAAEGHAVILSCDELTKALGDDLGDRHDAVAARVQAYLRSKAVELVRAGVDVILEWGFWRAADRAAMSRYLRETGVPFEWHGVALTQAQLEANIARRNANPGPGDYIVDEGLLRKCLSAWEPPSEAEMDFWHRQ